MNITDLLVLMQRIGKIHEQMLKELCRQYDLSLIEAKIIAFLHNNPTKDTAGMIFNNFFIVIFFSSAPRSARTASPHPSAWTGGHSYRLPDISFRLP